MCHKGIGWDELLPTELRPRWESWLNDFTNLGKIQIPRCFTPPNIGKILRTELHQYSDASSKGYDQCSYIRLVSESKVHCALVMGKARVAPTKVVTVPRLELTAAVMSAAVSSMLKEELALKVDREYFWTDSQVVLGYINNEARRFHVFVVNHVQRIRETTDPRQWYYIKTGENPADYASRGLTTEELVNSSWLTGPRFLWEKERNRMPSKRNCMYLARNLGSCLATIPYQETNFIGAKSVLKNALKELSKESVAPYLATQQCDFCLNAPSLSHAGGIWERQIRTVKSVICSVLAQSAGRLNDSSLRTFFYGAMVIVNNRPLTVDGLSDPTRLEPLTPNHLLTMKSSVSLPPPGIFDKEDLYAKKRQRWHTPRQNMQVGDVVIVKEGEVLCNEWRMARVLEVCKDDDDGLVRKATIQMGYWGLGKKGDTYSMTRLEFRHTEMNARRIPACVENMRRQNTNGSFYCICDAGFRLKSGETNNDKHELCEIEGVCEIDKSICGGGVCKNSKDGHECVCSSGFTNYELNCDTLLSESKASQASPKLTKLVSLMTNSCLVLSQSESVQNNTQVDGEKLLKEFLSELDDLPHGGFRGDNYIISALFRIVIIILKLIGHLLSASRIRKISAKADVELLVKRGSSPPEGHFLMNISGAQMTSHWDTATRDTYLGFTSAVLLSYKGLEESLNCCFNHLETEQKQTFKINSKVVTATFSNYETKTNLTKPVNLTFSHLKRKNEKHICVFWDPELEGGAWSTRGCITVRSRADQTVCSCYKLGSFAVLTALCDTGVCMLNFCQKGS
ncbi:Adhesion G protein-coupled receptor E2 [Labeo rohita]|uniref:Adhesion G protein-coupled receptor E2 n=1 Tax=Labeo rohita TaxID=84645 RepID=A0ABQ8LB82_LABRO|nr:Adhesion G protein-coupled receptor E2 [Labeo rohita]